jgi:hypothetical protein
LLDRIGPGDKNLSAENLLFQREYPGDRDRQHTRDAAFAPGCQP